MGGEKDCLRLINYHRTKLYGKENAQMANKKSSKPKAPKSYKGVKAPAKYKSTTVAPATYAPGTYNSEYADQIKEAQGNLLNWDYDPMADANYQALAKVYGARGNIAAKDTLGDAASLNGGYGTSNAVSAAQQARNQYNQELAAMIPDLEQNAYNRAMGNLGVLTDADETAYGRFRDTESDNQWKYSQDYQKWRDLEADNQWKYTTNYNRWCDKTADKQWNYTQGYNQWRDLTADWQWQQQYDQSKKSSAGGGSGGGRRSSGGGGGYSGGSSGSGTNPVKITDADPTKYAKVHLWNDKKKIISKKTTTKPVTKYTGKGR
jgi:hypothetical protein